MMKKKVEFKAGLMHYNPETKLVKADRRPGKAVVEHVGADQIERPGREDFHLEGTQWSKGRG